MERRTLRFGVVGLSMGAYPCEAISRAKGSQLVAACDLDPDRLKPVVEKYKVKGYESFAEMLRDPEIDVVSVATPSGLHADMAMEAVAAGKHIFVEKPVDIDVAKIKRLAKAVRKAKLKGGTVFQSRTETLNKRIKAAVDQGRLGRLVGVHAILPSWREQSYYEGKHGTWRGTWAMDGGGSMMNQGVHTVDLIQWFAGPVTAVFGRFGVFAHKIEAEDKTVACLEFANGALGTLSTTTAAWGGEAPIIILHGDQGTICKTGHLRQWKLKDDKDGQEEKELLSYYGPKEQKSEGAKLATDPMALSSSGHQFQIEDLVEAIWADRDPFVTIESGMHAGQIVNAVYQSGRTGRRVTIR